MSRAAVWRGRTALITGASSGIGAAIALRLAREGLAVILAARRADRLERLQAEIESAGGRAAVTVADLSQTSARERLAEDILSRTGAPDVLVNNAGLGWYGYFSAMPLALAQEMLAVNVGAAVHLTRLCLPGMCARRSGHVINISSIAGGLPNQGIALYAASKAFLDAFTTALHRELRGSGVHASVVRPGPVVSEFFDSAAGRENGGEVPARAFAVSAERVAGAVWGLLRRPRRVVYVPGYLAVSPWLEHLFAPLIDWLGPLLLRRGTRKSPPTDVIFR